MRNKYRYQSFNYRGISSETDWILFDSIDRSNINLNYRSNLSHYEFIKKFWKLTLFIILFVFSLFIYDLIFYKNKDLIVDDILVSTNGYLPEDTIVEISGIKKGDKIMNINLNGVRDSLLNKLSIEDVIVRRELPNKIKIDIKEMKPIAWFSSPVLGISFKGSKKGAFLSKKGVIFPSQLLKGNFNHLPEVRVLDISREDIDKRVNSGDQFVLNNKKLDSAVRLLNFWNKSDLLKQSKISNIKFNNQWSMICYAKLPLDGKNEFKTKIKFSILDLERGFNDYKLVFNETITKNVFLSTIDLRVKNNIPATFYSNVRSIAGVMNFIDNDFIINNKIKANKSYLVSN